MNLLVVDDEMLEVELITKIIDWESLGVEEVYTAYSCRQAIVVMESHDISIMICDIQMPQESGHTLVTWIREQGLDVEVIFLTGHALFGYAQKAIQLGVNDYILKPVDKEELEKAVQNAINHVQIKEQIAINKRNASYWNVSKVILWQEAWKKALLENIPNSMEAVKRLASRYDVIITEEDLYYPILFVWKKVRETEQTGNTSVIEFSIKNVVSEMLFGDTSNSNIISMDDNKVIVLYEIKGKTNLLMEEKCRIILSEGLMHLHMCEVGCYIAEAVKLSRLKVTVRELLHSSKTDILKPNTVCAIRNTKQTKWNYEKPDMKAWIGGLFTAQYEKSVQDVRSYLDTLVVNKHAKYAQLNQFQHDFLQELYIELEKRGIQAHSILKEGKMVDLFNDASNSVADMGIWLHEIAILFINHQCQTEKMPTIVNTIKTFIEEHSSETISRNDLAAKVYLNPDYLLRIFKEQMHISISDYIIQVRLEKANILLLTTDEQIVEISGEVGYPNTSYFTKIFKRIVGTTPKEFRKNRGIVK